MSNLYSAALYRKHLPLSYVSVWFQGQIGHRAANETSPKVFWRILSGPHKHPTCVEGELAPVAIIPFLSLPSWQSPFASQGLPVQELPQNLDRSQSWLAEQGLDLRPPGFQSQALGGCAPSPRCCPSVCGPRGSAGS